MSSIKYSDIKYYVAGSITIPIFFPTHTKSEAEAYDYVASILNSKNISVIHGDITTLDGKEYPLVAKRCKIEWFDVTDSAF